MLVLVHSHYGSARKAALHLRFVRLAPSMQTPQPLNTTNATVQLLSGTVASSAAAGSEGAAARQLPGLPGHYARGGYERRRSGGLAVRLLGVTESRSVYGEGGGFVKLSPSVVQRILAAMDKLANASAGMQANSSAAKTTNASAD